MHRRSRMAIDTRTPTIPGQRPPVFDDEADIAYAKREAKREVFLEYFKRGGYILLSGEGGVVLVQNTISHVPCRFGSCAGFRAR